MDKLQPTTPGRTPVTQAPTQKQVEERPHTNSEETTVRRTSGKLQSRLFKAAQKSLLSRDAETTSEPAGQK